LSNYFLRTQNLQVRAGLSQEEIMPTLELAKRWVGLYERALREGSFTVAYKTLIEPRDYELTFKVLKKGEKPFVIAVFGKDVTENKLIDERLKRDKEQMESMNEKLRVVGGLTRRDIGNRVLAAKTNVSFLKKRVEDAELLEYVSEVSSALEGVEDFLELGCLYEKIGMEQITSVNVGKCFDKAASLFPGLDGKLVVNRCKNLAVMADSLLARLFYNLLENTLRYGENFTCVKLSFDKDESQLRLFYEDDGVGIPESNKPRLFEKGFSTANRGAGLGLFLIKRIVEVYGWAIAENGEPGKGARFVIIIPLRAETIGQRVGVES